MRLKWLKMVDCTCHRFRTTNPATIWKLVNCVKQTAEIHLKIVLEIVKLKDNVKIIFKILTRHLGNTIIHTIVHGD